MKLFNKLFSGQDKTRLPPITEITANELKQLLDKEVSPLLLKRNLQYDGQYTWYGEMENHMRKSVSVFLLKGTVGIFKWSVTFDFIPLPSGERLVYSRTEKNIKAHLFELPDDYLQSFRGSSGLEVWKKSACKFSRHGKQENPTDDISAQIRTAFVADVEKLSHLHDECTTIADALKVVDDKLNSQNNMDIFHRLFPPSPIYVKAFLLTATGKKREGKDLLEQHLLTLEWNDSLKTKVLQKLDSL